MAWDWIDADDKLVSELMVAKFINPYVRPLAPFTNMV